MRLLREFPCEGTEMHWDEADDDETYCPAGIYLFKVNNQHTIKCEKCSELILNMQFQAR